MELREQNATRPGTALGEQIRERREALGLTLRAAGAKAGLSHAYIGSIERGRDVAASPETLAKLAYALQMPPGWLGIEAPDEDLLQLPVSARRHLLALRRVREALERLARIDVRVDAAQAATAAEAASQATAEGAAKLELLAADLEAEAQEEEQAVLDRFRALEAPATAASRSHHDDYY